VYPDEVVRDDKKWGHSASAAAIWRLVVGADFSHRVARGKTYPHDSPVISIALQKEIYMQSNKKREEKH
jgi:hypothetical protein